MWSELLYFSTMPVTLYLCWLVVNALLSYGTLSQLLTRELQGSILIGSSYVSVILALTWGYNQLLLESVIEMDVPNLLVDNTQLHIEGRILFPFIYIFLLITVVSILTCLVYSQHESLTFVIFVSLILVIGFNFFTTDSLILFFFLYEGFLVPSFFILYKFAKTRKCIEASFLMFFWTQFGALFLILAFVYISQVTGLLYFSQFPSYAFSQWEINFLTVLFLLGFGVKIPLWPFYGWLPKAHVEASTNFSIFLSGVLVKFAFFGLFRCLHILGVEIHVLWIIPFLLVGLFDATFKLFAQNDLKKLIAYATVVEMHWLTICLISGYTPLLLSGLCMLLNHALLSTNAFLLVDAIARRFQTRLVSELGSLNVLTPNLFILALLNTLLFLGFPGSLSFVCELLFFIFLWDLSPLVFVLLLPLLYLLAPTFFFRTWLGVLFGTGIGIRRRLVPDLLISEGLLNGFFIILSFWLGLSWGVFLY